MGLNLLFLLNKVIKSLLYQVKEENNFQKSAKVTFTNLSNQVERLDKALDRVLSNEEKIILDDATIILAQLINKISDYANKEKLDDFINYINKYDEHSISREVAIQP